MNTEVANRRWWAVQKRVERTQKDETDMSSKGEEQTELTPRLRSMVRWTADVSKIWFTGEICPVGEIIFHSFVFL